MAELVREIEKEDIVEIKKLLNKVFGISEFIDIKRLGGMMNHSYKVTLENREEFLVRIPGEGTDEMINRIDEKKSTELACKLGIDSELLYFDEKGYKLMRFIKNPQPMSEDVMKREDIIKQAANIFSKLHNSLVDTGVIFDVFEKALLYEKIISDYQVSLYDDYSDTRSYVFDLYKGLQDKSEINIVPCHNDSLVDNWVLDEDDRLYLIDWEFSGMNDAVWDLSCLSIEANYSDVEDNILLKSYYQRNITDDERKHFIIEKILIDYLWTLWGLARVPFDGDFMREYASGRYERLHDNIKQYKKIK